MPLQTNWSQGSRESTIRSSPCTFPIEDGTSDKARGPRYASIWNLSVLPNRIQDVEAWASITLPLLHLLKEILFVLLCWGVRQVGEGVKTGRNLAWWKRMLEEGTYRKWARAPRERERRETWGEQRPHSGRDIKEDIKEILLSCWEVLMHLITPSRETIFFSLKRIKCMSFAYVTTARWNSRGMRESSFPGIRLHLAGP